MEKKRKTTEENTLKAGKDCEKLPLKGYVPDEAIIDDPIKDAATEKSLSDYTVAELKDLAEDEGIDLSGATLKKEIIATIEKARDGEDEGTETETDASEDSPADDAETLDENKETEETEKDE